jgi:hypothetical protein
MVSNEHTARRGYMMIYLHPLLSLIAGILILVYPRLLNLIVAIYLIVTGVAGILGPNL